MVLQKHEKFVNHKFPACNLIFIFLVLLPLSFIKLTNHKKACSIAMCSAKAISSICKRKTETID